MSPTHTGSSTLKPYRHFPMASLATAIAVSACLMGAQASESSQPPASPAEISSQQTEPTAADYSRPAQERVASMTALRQYLKFKDEVWQTQRARQSNTFCFVQQRPDHPSDPEPNVWMVWLNGGEIVNMGWHLYSPKTLTKEDAKADGESLARMKSIKLATDVRETAQEIYGSSFLVERAWVNRLLAQCKAKGRTIKVTPAR
ncbi:MULTISPECIES: hypothetical protein [Delftia]|uniref:Lipoprotein n=1 Tax=Delftia acidovorans TaxID=80866 RepID=A0AAJ2VDA6_DELAC|nr:MULTISPECIES: hypothetical protein [Delftia]MDX4954627.1 hypothetical protein [Delftia acidovorans]MDX4957444.1 hypothetical protein [Delftia acidovorans]